METPDQPDSPVLLTLKSRVAKFWEYFSAEAPRILEAINSNNFKAGEDIRVLMGELFPGLGWTFGPGEDAESHSFTITGEGNPYKRLVADFWLRQAPKLRGWTFHSSRQASRPERLNHLMLSAGGIDFRADALWLTPHLLETSEKLHLTLWHPQFRKAPPDLAKHIALLWLNEALGEDNMENRIGGLAMSDEKSADAIPLTELPGYLRDVCSRLNWNTVSLGWLTHGQEDRGSRPRRPGRLREDIVSGVTRIRPLALGYPLREHPLPGIGVEFYMAVFPKADLAAEEPLSGRYANEEELDAALSQASLGETLGGATGSENVYIDMALYDGGASFRLAEAVLKGMPGAAGGRLEPFVVP